MAHATAGSFGIFLVVIFGFVKSAGRGDFSDDWVFEISLRLQFYGLGYLFLLIVKVENSRAVAIAHVRALAVKLGGVMHPEKLAAKHLVAYFVRVELQFNGFGMTSFVGANLFVGGIFSLTASIANRGLSHARHLVKIILDSPETASREDCFHVFIVSRLNLCGKAVAYFTNEAYIYEY